MTCRSHFTGTGINKTTAKQTRQTQQTQSKTNNKKEPVKILAKVVKPARPPKPLILCLPPYSMSSMPSISSDVRHVHFFISLLRRSLTSGKSRRLSWCVPSLVCHRICTVIHVCVISARAFSSLPRNARSTHEAIDVQDQRRTLVFVAPHPPLILLPPLI